MPYNIYEDDLFERDGEGDEETIPYAIYDEKFDSLDVKLYDYDPCRLIDKDGVRHTVFFSYHDRDASQGGRICVGFRIDGLTQLGLYVSNGVSVLEFFDALLQEYPSISPPYGFRESVVDANLRIKVVNDF